MIVNLDHLGRIGQDAPSEYIIASMTALLGAYAYPSVIAFSHRFSRRTLARSVLYLSALSGAVMLVFMQREAFDEMHQKRLFVIHMENVRTPSSSEFSSPLTHRFADPSDHDEREPLAHWKCGRCAWL